jgi:hypothetical protein
MKRAAGLVLMIGIVSAMVIFLVAPVFAGPQNAGGVVVEKGDAPDCVGGSCGGVIVEDPNGKGPDCTGGNCGGSVCQGTDCGSCDGGNCGGSISGPGTAVAAKPAAKQLPRTGMTLPTASTIALGAGMVLAGLFYLFVANPSTKLAMGMLDYRPRRKL